eukprot:4116131-Pleurochrysis_carterae.AAC.1
MLRKVEDFLEKRDGGKPSLASENVEEKRFAEWVRHQESHYKQHAKIMKDEAIREMWANFVEAHAHVFH